MYYCVDTQSGKRTSLGTRDGDEAQAIVHSKKRTLRHPTLNLQIARAYLAGSGEGMEIRTWQYVIDEIIRLRQGETRRRWLTASKDKAFDAIRHRLVWETRSEEFLRVLGRGSVSTNVYLRRLHNFALDMNWLPWPVIPKRQWPKVEYKKKRAITAEEHLRIIEREQNPERKAFYELAWYLGASQGDLAQLRTEDIDWSNRIISFERLKLGERRVGQLPQISFGSEVATILRQLPVAGPLFPRLINVRASDRATEFKQRCRGLGIHDITLHSYRYAWAERAKTVGYPERFAQMALGHNSKAVHRAYAKNALVKLPALEDYEKASLEKKIIPMLTASTIG